MISVIFSLYNVVLNGHRLTYLEQTHTGTSVTDFEVLTACGKF